MHDVHKKTYKNFYNTVNKNLQRFIVTTTISIYSEILKKSELIPFSLKFNQVLAGFLDLRESTSDQLFNSAAVKTSTHFKN